MDILVPTLIKLTGLPFAYIFFVEMAILALMLRLFWPRISMVRFVEYYIWGCLIVALITIALKYILSCGTGGLMDCQYPSILSIFSAVFFLPDLWFLCFCNLIYTSKSRFRTNDQLGNAFNAGNQFPFDSKTLFYTGVFVCLFLGSIWRVALSDIN
jgi:hypothetical protein